MDIAFLLETTTKLLQVLPLTVLLWALSVSLGGALALGLVWMRVSGPPVLKGFARAYIFVFRGSPLLVQMFLIYYGLGQFAFVQIACFGQSCANLSLARSSRWRFVPPVIPQRSSVGGLFPCPRSRWRRRAPAVCPGG